MTADELRWIYFGLGVYFGILGVIAVVFITGILFSGWSLSSGGKK